MKSLTLLILTFCSTLSYGQYQAEEFEASLLQAKYGGLLVYNGKKNSFTLRFEAKKLEPTKQPNFVRVDDVLMQSSIVAFTNVLDFGHLDINTQKQTLISWKDYEQKWIEEEMKVQLQSKFEFVSLANQIFIRWTFDMPPSKEKEAVVKQLYLVTICFDQMLILNAPIEQQGNETLVNRKLLAVASTLKLYPDQLQDLNQLYNDLKK